MSEARRVRINEDILTRCSGVDSTLPFRLQKRQLFKNLDFPTDKKIVSMPVQDESKIRKTLSEFVEDKDGEREFLIITSPKPMLTWIPPLFRVNREEKLVVYRDEQGNIQSIELQQILIKIRKLPPKSWVEFGRHLWRKDTTAGRLVYVSAEEQILEIQKGVEIPAIDKNPTASFRATLSFFELAGLLDERKLAHCTGFEWHEVKRMVYCLGEHYQGFEDLRRIANLPALEFAYTKHDGLIVIDVDWPAQYRL